MTLVLKWGIKLMVLIAAVVSFTGLSYRLIGLWNRRYGTWTSVFFCYAGSDKFIKSYGIPGIAHFFRWRPTPIGVMRQNGEWGLVVASSMSESAFLDPRNAGQFTALQQRLQRIAKQTGIAEINVAGILPGVLKQTGGMAVKDTRATVVDAVSVAVTDTLNRHLPAGTRDVIILGGAGRIGAGVVARLTAQGLTCHSIDTKTGGGNLPAQLQGTPVLFVDIARKGAVADYIGQMWQEVVVLNEVFPAPSRRLVTQMKARGVQVFHLAGVAGRIIPPLPHGYENAIPCCAAMPTKDEFDVRIIAL